MRATIARGVAHFSYTPLLGLAAAVAFGKLIVYAKLVAVEQYGALGQMLLVSSAVGIVGSLGLQSVASRNVPALFVRGRQRRGVWLLAQTVAVSTWFALLLTLAAAAGLSLFGLRAEELTLGILHGWAQLTFLTLASESRSRLEMLRYARQMALRNVVIAAAGFAFAAFGSGAKGVILAETAGTLAFCLLLGRSVLARARLHGGALLRALDLRRRRLPWRAALLMLAGTAVLFVSFNADRWIAAETLPRDAFGVYAFGWLALLAAQSVHGLLNSSLLPLLSRRRALALDASAYRLTALISAALLAGGLSVVLPTAWALAWAVEHWMPQYAAARPLWVPMLLAAVLRVSDFWSSLLLAVEREGLLLAVQALAVLAAGVGYLAWLAIGAEAPTPVSLAWFAVATAFLSYGSSAAAAVCIRSEARAT